MSPVRIKLPVHMVNSKIVCNFPFPSQIDYFPIAGRGVGSVTSALDMKTPNELIFTLITHMDKLKRYKVSEILNHFPFVMVMDF